MKTKFEKSKGLETVTFPEGIAYFKLLAELFLEISIREMGETDSGHPLHLVIFSFEQDFNFSSASGPEFAKDGPAQLVFIYQHSPQYEPAYLRYPVYRLLKIIRDVILKFLLSSCYCLSVKTKFNQ